MRGIDVAATQALVKEGFCTCELVEDALHVFDDVAAAPDPAVLWHYAQQLPRLGAGIGDGDGLGAAQGHQQFLPKDAEVILIKCLIHAVSLSYLGWYLKMNTCKAQANRIK